MRWGGRPARAVIAVLSLAMIGTAFALAGHIVFFLHRSSTRGAALVHAERRLIAAAAGDAAACQPAPGDGTRDSAGSAPGTTAGPAGLLQAPSLGLVAPVLQGTSDAVLDDAVGHLPASAWPGQPGTSVLAAHDVTWFSRITRLKPGDVVRYVTRCRTYSYQVTAHAIVSAGAPLHSTRGSSLVLDTCYPLDALFTTSSRYLVYATLVQSSPTHPSAPAPGSWPQPAVPAPAALSAQGLSDAQNYAPLGTLRITGTPAIAWRQSSAPLGFQNAALAEFFGLTRSAAEGRRAWWSALAPAVPAADAGALWNHVIATYDTRLSVTLSVRGGQPQGAAVSALVTMTGAGAPGSYRVTVTETVRGGQLLATGVRVSRPG